MVSFAETQKQLLFKIVGDGRRPGWRKLYQKFLYLTSSPATQHSNTGIAPSWSPSPLQPGLLWESSGKRILSKTVNEKTNKQNKQTEKPQQHSNELKSKVYTGKPVKRMIECSANTLIFHFPKLSINSMRTLKIHHNPCFLDLGNSERDF